MDGLNKRQRRFCLEYIKDKNGSRAARAAGYSAPGARRRATELLRTPQVRAFIRTLINEQSARLKIDADRVINELARIAFFDSTVFEKITEGEMKLSDLSADERAAISEFTVNETETRDKYGSPVVQKNIKIKAHSKIRALDSLAKHFNLFKEHEMEKGKALKLAYALDQLDED